MVQAFGREDDVRARFGVKARAVRDGVLRQARIEGAYLPGPALPADGVDRRRASGLRRARRHPRRPDDRRVLPLLLAAAPARLAARGARLDHQPRPARDRVGVAQLRLARAASTAIPEPTDPRTLPGGPARRPLRGRPLLVRHRHRGAARRRRRRGRRARSSPSAARRAPARRRCSTCCRASTTRRAGRVLVGGVDVRDVRDRRPALVGRDRHAAPDPLLDPAPRQPHRRPARRPLAGRARRLRGGRRRPSSRTSCPTATTR